MEIKFTAVIESDEIEKGKKIYTGWINEISNVIAQGETIKEVKIDLMKLLRIRLELNRRNTKSASDQLENCTFVEFDFELRHAYIVE